MTSNECELLTEVMIWKMMYLRRVNPNPDLDGELEVELNFLRHRSAIDVTMTSEQKGKLIQDVSSRLKFT